MNLSLDQSQSPIDHTEVDGLFPHDFTASEVISTLMNDDNKGPLFFDLETVPDDSGRVVLDEDGRGEVDSAEMPFIFDSISEAQDYLKSHKLSEAQLEYLDDMERSKDKPRKGILDAISSEKKRQASAEESRRLALSTVPEYCRIAAMGIARGNSPIRSILIHNDEQEAQALRAWWKIVVMGDTPCGYNILGFDLPVIFARTAILDRSIKTKLIDLRPWGNTIDIYAKRFPRGSSGAQPGKLKEIAPLYGIDVPAGDVDGSEVADLYRDDPVKLAEYVQSDVHITRELYRKWKGLFV